MSQYAASLEEIQEAARRIAPEIHRTPVLTCAAIDAAAGSSIHIKCENLQRVGAFKIRGATNAVLSLSEGEAARGVVTHSSGNHAQALALAARRRGIVAHVVMPTNAPAVKRAATEGYGAIVHPCEPNLAAREAGARAVIAETGATLVPPYDDPRVIAGQGTVALEILEQVPDVDTIVAPVGGGGLISGIALAVAEAAPHIEVVAAEPRGADDAWRSKQAGERILQTAPDTIADGLRTSLGEYTWPVVRELVSEIVRVEEEEIRAAMRWVFSRAKLVVEPSGAVSLAAAMRADFRRPGARRRVVVVLSGGNVDVRALGDLLG